jgi:hypothetical protein
MIHELLGRTVEEAQANPVREPISDVVAGRHDEALAKLRVLLTRRGMRSQVVEWLKLTLRSSRFPLQPTSALVRYPPELLVFSPQGWRVATVRRARSEVRPGVAHLSPVLGDCGGQEARADSRAVRAGLLVRLDRCRPGRPGESTRPPSGPPPFFTVCGLVRPERWGPMS